MAAQENLVEITVWYRGVTEGRLSRKIANALADAARAKGKHVQAFDNYVDLPDRVGIPCRSYARICPDPIAEPYIYENHNPSVVVCTDAALVKGCNVLKGLEPGGVLVVNTKRSPENIYGLLEGLPDLVKLRTLATVDAGSGAQPYTPQGGVEGATEKATTFRTASVMLGAIARVTDLVEFETLAEREGDTEGLHKGLEGVSVLDNPAYDPDTAAPGGEHKPYQGKVDLILKAPEPGGENALFVTGNFRTVRPVVDQEACTGCKICWLACPDSCITMHQDSDIKVEINLKYCKGCGLCREVCPVDCIEEKDELDFAGDMVRITY